MATPNSQTPPQPSALTELIHGRFVDVSQGAYLDPSIRVMIQAGRLLLTPPGQEIRVERVIDLGGRAVLPGLFNTHCHLQMTSPALLPDLATLRLSRKLHGKQIEKTLSECLGRGVTHIRDCYCEDLGPARGLQDRLSRREIPGPRLHQAVVVGPEGGYLTQRVGLAGRLLRSAMGMPVKDAGLANSGKVVFGREAGECEVRGAVDRAVDERGADLIKIGEQKENMLTFKPDGTIMSQDQLDWLVDQARARGMRTTMHCVSVDSFRRGVRAGVHSLAHLPRDGRLEARDALSYRQAGGVVEPTVTVAYDVCWPDPGDAAPALPALTRLDVFRLGTEAALAEAFYLPGLARAAIKTHEKIRRGRRRMLGLLNMKPLFRYYLGILEHGLPNARLLFEEGMEIGLGNDGGVPVGTPAMVGHELKLLDLLLSLDTGPGLSPAQAVRIATLGSARAMGLEDRFGSIETGKTADLVVLDGDPLAEAGLVGEPAAAVFLEGDLVIDRSGLGIAPGW
jgi:imidazolonepropionase-like amidohydrolase